MALTCSILKPCNYLQVAQRLFIFGSSRTLSRRYHSLQKKATGTKLASSQTQCFLSRLTPSMYTSYKREMSQQTSDSDFIFRQLLEHKSFTLTYILADKESKEAIVIDPVIDTVDRDIRIVTELGLTLKYALNTHVHADHITGTGELKKHLPACKSVIAKASGAKADVLLKEGDCIQFGKYKVEARSTPGHTNGCLTYVWHEKGMVFTGDAVLIRGCGRTDFQEGDPALLYDSVHRNIFSLPEKYLLYPAHDYTGQTVSSVEEEKTLNSRLTKPKDQFIEIMKNLNLAYPKQIDSALPANLVCGVFDVNKQLVE